MTDLPTCGKAPCASCPYRRDVPAGVWDATEYDKLPQYDGETWEQSPALFYCHQQDGKLCAGWVACHDTDHLLALRLRPVDRSVFTYQSPVPIFATGAEARAHGLSGIEDPDIKARRVIDTLVRKRNRRDR